MAKSPTCKTLIMKCYQFPNESAKFTIEEIWERIGRAYSQNNIGTRLPEMALEGKLKGDYREGKNYKEWGLAVKEETVHIVKPRFSFEADGQMVMG